MSFKEKVYGGHTGRLWTITITHLEPKALAQVSELKIKKKCSGTLSECQTVWIQIKIDIMQPRKELMGFLKK